MQKYNRISSIEASNEEVGPIYCRKCNVAGTMLAQMAFCCRKCSVTVIVLLVMSESMKWYVLIDG